MLEVLKNFEQIGSQLASSVNILLGLTLTIAGLFIWLAGINLNRLVITLVGIVCGITTGLLFKLQNTFYLVISAITGAALAILLQRVFIAVFALTIAGILTFATLSTPYFHQPEDTPWQQYNDTQNQLSPSQSLDILQSFAVTTARQSAKTAPDIPITRWAIVIIFALIFGIAGFIFKKTTASLCYSAIGVLMIFVGMILLLWYKGSLPVQYISIRKPYFQFVFAIMTAFGLIIQMLFASHNWHLIKRDKGQDQGEE